MVVTAVWAVLLAAIGMGAGPRIASAQSIYTCVDASKRTLTSDRPIPECRDREQKELNASGSVRRSVGPTLTAVEQAAQDEKRRAASLETARRNEEQRREKALLSRYPDKSAHDRVRAESLVHIADIIRGAAQQIEELRKQRKQLDAEMEFFKSNPAKAPPALRRQLEENESNVAIQKRFIGDQEGEKNRANARFDEELARLTPRWQASASVAR